ncbi:hypothetical protein N180_02785 [Pedobacter antarcticus 4BY]|uniref:Uncharacterized protein n=2 Tax=Pedobacter antarcticus TaxID=34086 RepID=A0A081PKG8_9SPHI|nr:hypothetical protein [Pedobacter antarcticus]KEQ31191.1 hypothetical protein N180_02785 [Pedobacter antarcticus 4BY]SFE54482.1 hypothetical protein SAMN03003324_00845 [Pedobacter antarcticus]
MGLFNSSRSDVAGRPMFPSPQHLQDFPGGGTLDKDQFPEGTILRTATIVSFDEATSIFKVLKTATIVEAAAADAVAYKIAKTVNDNDQPHLILKTDVLAKTVGGPSYAVATIDQTNSAFDTITFGTSLGAMAVGDVLFHSAASGADKGALKVIPNGVLRNDIVVEKNTFGPIIRVGAVYNRRLPFKAPQAVKDALKGFIYFSEQR